MPYEEDDSSVEPVHIGWYRQKPPGFILDRFHRAAGIDADHGPAQHRDTTATHPNASFLEHLVPASACLIIPENMFGEFQEMNSINKPFVFYRVS
jgi:hypothetical protein